MTSDRADTHRADTPDRTVSWSDFAAASPTIAAAGAGHLGECGPDEWPPRYRRWSAAG